MIFLSVGVDKFLELDIFIVIFVTFFEAQTTPFLAFNLLGVVMLILGFTLSIK